MAAVGPQIDDLKLFRMDFNQMIRLKHLIRSGNQMEPIHADLRVGRRDPTPYEEAMGNPQGADPPPIDFYVDDAGEIDTELSTGKNFCSFWKSIEGLSSFPPSFTVRVLSLASHQCGPDSIPGFGVICGLSLLLVLVLAPRGNKTMGVRT